MKHIPRKRFGQNFLQDQGIIHQIIECIAPTAVDTIVEIGPGLAALTKPLIQQIGHLQVVELDNDIIKFLQENFSSDEITIHSGDALQFDFSFNNAPIRVVGNLPYNISTPLLFHLSQFPNIKNMVFMLQDEVVKRICAKPDNGDYGRLSVMLQYKFKCSKLLDVPPESFYPAPKVNSAIVSLTPRDAAAWQEVDENKLNLVVSTAFNQRRKTVSNSLKALFSAEELKNLAINPQNRAENLSIEDYLRLAQNLARQPI